MRILVTGAQGQLGRSIANRAAEKLPGAEFIFTDIQELDITDPLAVDKAIRDLAPELVINCAAYTAVDKAESDSENANRLNALAPGILAEACNLYNARIIHISTDYVFSGRNIRPYREDDPTDPQGAYGRTKQLGEQNVLKHAPQSLIIRTSWLYSEYGNNFVKTMLRLGQEKDEISVVNDQSGNPTWAGDLADALLHIAGTTGLWTNPGIYHYANSGTTTWFGLASAVMEIAGLSCKVKPITTLDYPTPAFRPPYSALDTTKIRHAFGLDIPSWRTSLEQCMHRLQDI